MITCHAPGELFVAGEYAVLQTRGAAVLTAVDRGVTVTVAAAEEGTGIALRSDLLGRRLVRCTRGPHGPEPIGVGAAERRALAYVLSAIEVVEQMVGVYRMPVQDMMIQVTTTLADSRGRKLGLGSSAAETVATVTALARFYTLPLGPMQRYRLAMLATLAISPRRSGGDLAAAVWGGWVAYSAPDREYLCAAMSAQGVVWTLHADWPGLSIRRLPAPSGLELHVGWTGEPAPAARLIGAVDPRVCDSVQYRTFAHGSERCVRSLVAALLAHDSCGVHRQVLVARELLCALDQAAGLGIMTPRLAALCAAADDIGVPAKPSGAGGGDCGIAFTRLGNAGQPAQLRDRWRADGIRPLAVHAARHGATTSAAVPPVRRRAH